MKNTITRKTGTVTACPWCHDIIPLEINIGFVNHHAPRGRRATNVTVRRTATIEHECVDPTTNEALT